MRHLALKLKPRSCPFRFYQVALSCISEQDTIDLDLLQLHRAKERLLEDAWAQAINVIITLGMLTGEVEVGGGGGGGGALIGRRRSNIKMYYLSSTSTSTGSI